MQCEQSEVIPNVECCWTCWALFCTLLCLCCCRLSNLQRIKPNSRDFSCIHTQLRKTKTAASEYEDDILKFCEESGLPVAQDETVDKIQENPLKKPLKLTHPSQEQKLRQKQQLH